MQNLLKQRGAFAFFTVVFLNAFLDLGHKIVIQNTIFKIYDGSTQVILTAIVNALILLPFILLFTAAGAFADRQPKSQVMRVMAWWALGLTLCIALCYYNGWFWPAFAMTFLLACQSAMYSPAKYGYIKSLFGKERLAEANGLVQTVTIVAILLGTFLYSIAFESLLESGFQDSAQLLKAIAPVSWLLVVNAFVELLVAYRLQNCEPDLQQVSTSGTRVKEHFDGSLAKKQIQLVTQQQSIFLAVIGLAIFWSIGQVMLAAFPAFAKETMGVTNTVAIQGVLAATGLGIAVGAALAGRISRGYIEMGLIPVGAVGICCTLFMVPSIDSLVLHALNFFVIGVMGGLFIVPLNSLVQFHAKSSDLGKVIASNNLLQNIAMLLFLLLTVAFALQGVSSKKLLSIVAFVALAGSFYTVYRLPQSLVRFVLAFLMSRRYRVFPQGVQNLPEQGGVLLLGNHISWVDWAIVQIACPRPIRFVMAKSIYQRWYLKWFFDLFGVIPISGGAGSQGSLETVARLLDNNEVVCLFPEGTISRTGHLVAFKKGFERACDLCENDIAVIPFYLRGLWGSQFSRSSDNLKRLRKEGGKRDLIVAFGQALPKSVDAETVKQRVFELSVSSWQQHVQQFRSLPAEWIQTVRGESDFTALTDSSGITLSSGQALVAAILVSRRIRREVKGQNIGLLLPTSVGGVIANMAVLLAGKTVVNLNFTASDEALASAIEQAEISTVYSSDKFLAKLNARGRDLSSVLENCKLIAIESVMADISDFEKTMIWLLIKTLPAAAINALFNQSKDTEAVAAILFSSGSEGLPKGVMLSHQNIMANLKQTSDVLNTQDDDVVMASLPLFHAFGLTVTQFMPLIEGMPIVCHPDPSDTVAIAKAIAKNRATVLCGTSTFLRFYSRNKKVHPLMLNSLRVVVAGAERLDPVVRREFQQKFSKTIYEGYGATETTPVASVNIPDALDTSSWQVQQGSEPGTVGMPLPGTSFRIVEPDSFKDLPRGEEGMVLIGGVQVMQGYLNNPEKTRTVIKEIDGLRWYVTGDKGKLDKNGFLTIVDRYSRFAKIGGEMVSLSKVEAEIRKVIGHDDIELLATTISDDKKGERIVLVTDTEIDWETTRQSLLECGLSPLTIPSAYIRLSEIPKLGAGKTDFTKAKSMVLEKVAAP